MISMPYNFEYIGQYYNYQIYLRTIILLPVIIWMSSNFLQRFKGKTTTLSKNQVHNILGSKNTASGQTNNQYSSQPNPSKNKQNLSVGQNTNSNFGDDIKIKNKRQASQPVSMKANKTQNPFLVSNPFYLDQEQREREEIQRKERFRIQQETRKAQQQQVKNEKKDLKQLTKTSGYSRSVQKKNATNKEWVRLGGLGANIGGDEWLQKKKKLQKMQQFAGQVKSINSQKIKPLRPDVPKKNQTKQVNARQKALQYSKNVPKPIIKKIQQEQCEQPQTSHQRKAPQQQGFTQLQIYQMKHEQLKKMIHNNY